MLLPIVDIPKRINFVYSDKRCYLPRKADLAPTAVSFAASESKLSPASSATSRDFDTDLRYVQSADHLIATLHNKHSVPYYLRKFLSTAMG